MFNPLIFSIMYVNFSAFSEVLRDLRGAGSIALPLSAIPEFMEYCNVRGVYPCGGAMCGPESTPLQWLYLDK